MLHKDIKKFKQKTKKLFCTPGHKGRLPRCFAAQIDVTELEGTDNLYDPRGIIGAAQDRAAKIFGVKKVFFLTCGATQGIFAMLAVFKNQRVRVERNSHKSIFEACQLFNIEPVFEGEEGSYAARIVTYPDYYGNTIDIKSIYNDCQKRGIFLLADAAHGSHFGFSPHLPEAASVYCDCLVMSAHKTLPALTQAAYLCVNNETLIQPLFSAYKRLGTTSPSYPILASLDYAASYLEKRGEKRFARLYAALQAFAAKLPPNIKHLPSEDFTRIVLEVEDGYALEKKLIERGFYPEFAQRDKVVFILSVADSARDVRRLSRAINALS